MLLTAVLLALIVTNATMDYFITPDAIPARRTRTLAARLRRWARRAAR